MHSSGTRSRLRRRATSTRIVSTVTAVAVALPAAYTFHGHFPGDQSGLLLLVAVAVGIPSAFDEYGPAFERRRDCVFATLWVCSVVVVTYVGSFAAGIDTLGVSPFLASIVAFLVGFLGPVGVLAALA